MIAEELCTRIQRSGRYGGPVSRIRCADGFSMSVQAGYALYCTPRLHEGPWTHVEVGFPSGRVEELMPYAEDPLAPTGTVYGYVPIEVVLAVIEAHGGAVS